MGPLICKEFVMLRRNLLSFAAAVIIIAGGASLVMPEGVADYLAGLAIVIGITIPQEMFNQEERGNTFVLLRSLPMQPWEIVAAKYVFLALVNLIFIAAFVGYQVVWPGPASIGPLVMVIFGGSAIGAVSLFLQFWLGPKSAQSVLIPFIAVVTGAGVALYIVAARRPDLLSHLAPSWLYRLMNLLGAHLGGSEGVVVAIVGAVVLMALSFWASASLFGRRDITQLP